MSISNYFMLDPTYTEGGERTWLPNFQSMERRRRKGSLSQPVGKDERVTEGELIPTSIDAGVRVCVGGEGGWGGGGVSFNLT